MAKIREITSSVSVMPFQSAVATPEVIKQLAKQRRNSQSMGDNGLEKRYKNGIKANRKKNKLARKARRKSR